ncbi:hypothetical protein [Sphingomicrobium clamense]|uniref:17 kDa surface antigen n=1 Tax=Sphingomicrobium clamense TaxID=2851013 RepID=A0ABS6V592_9SPHN|nr:hypothetical protein [Sphingomicrobium sp. B8]MBW0144367.1 hypothetical protein [Sphingomicrobium sp. B8]
MLRKTKILLTAGAAAAAAATFATPASAQYYDRGYSQGGDVLGAIIRGVLGAGRYGQYPYGNYGYNQGYYGERNAINQCSRAVENEINRRVNARYDRYDRRYDSRYDRRYDRRYDDRYDRRYDRRYGDRYERVPDRYRTDPYVRNYGSFGGQARIAGITDVKRKGWGTQVKGVAMSGRYATNYNRYDRRGYGYGQRPDIKWNCEIDRRGYIRDIDIKRR